MSEFKDHFSTRAREYSLFRPGYPDELFAWLAALAPGRSLAVDIATGNGQAAVGLARHFDRVIGIDASERQISHAAVHPRVEYRIALAHRTDVPDRTVELVTVAQALHWLPLDSLVAELRRLLVEDGVFAAWGYRLASVASVFDEQLTSFYRDVVGPYWPPERALVDSEYRTIHLPFREVPAPPFVFQRMLTRGEFAGFVGTWSAVQRYRQAVGADPVAQLGPALEREWPDPITRRLVTWPIFVRAGRAGGAA